MRTLQTRLLATAAMACIATTPLGFAKPADTQNSEVHFVAHQSESPVDGRFGNFLADVTIDLAHPQDGKVRVSIDVASVDAGGADTNILLRSHDFFDVSTFPKASFESSAIEVLPGGRLQVRGSLTMKGRVSVVSIPFTTRKDAAGTWFEGSTTVSRLAFGIGEGQWADTGTIDDTVQIRFKILTPT